MSKRKAISKKTRIQVFEKCHQRCAYCGCKLDYKELRVDHIESVYVNTDLTDNMTQEKINDIENLNPSCIQCNFYKSTMDIEQFRKQLTTTLMNNLQKNFNYRLALKYGLVEEHIHPVKFYFETLNEEE